MLIKTLEEYKKLSKSEIEIEFDDNFNEKIIIQNNIKKIKFGKKFNQKIIIPNSVTHLTFGENFIKKS